MVIYRDSIQNFINHSNNSKELIARIKAELREKLGRGVSPSESRSWEETLTKVAKLLDIIKNKDRQYVLLEFKVPYSQKRIDVMLAGANEKDNILTIAEIKGWGTSYTTSMDNTLKIDARYLYSVHPLFQSNEYRRILTNRFSEISSYFKDIDSIAILPNYINKENDPLFNSRFQSSMDLRKVFTKTNISGLQEYLINRFKYEIDFAIVDKLNSLEYKPTKDFIAHMENQFKEIELSSSQWLAFEQTKKLVDENIINSKNKSLFIISGMAGSGKTIVAFKLLHYLYINKIPTRLQLPGPEFRDAVQKLFKDRTLVDMIGGAYSKVRNNDVIIIDEAHKASGQGTAKQFYGELFDSQSFIIALLDDNQVINKQGILKKDLLEKAKKRNFKTFEWDLQEQFRNSGDSTYIDWLKNWIFRDDNQQDEFTNHQYKFKVQKDKEFNDLYKNMYEKENVRMISFWTQGWNTGFDETGSALKKIRVGSSYYVWNPNWKWKEEFEKEHPHQKIPADFLKNVILQNFNTYKKGWQYIAYFNTVQGSEFNYAFVHIPKLFYLNEKEELDVNLNELDFYDMKSQVWMKNKKPNPAKEYENKLYFKNRLLVALTRGIKGTFIYCEDDKLDKWLRKKLRYPN